MYSTPRSRRSYAPGSTGFVKSVGKTLAPYFLRRVAGSAWNKASSYFYGKKKKYNRKKKVYHKGKKQIKGVDMGKRKKRPARTIPLRQVKKDVQMLKGAMNKKDGTMTFRRIDTGRVVIVQNLQNWANVCRFDRTNINLNVSKLLYMDVNAGGALQEVSALGTTYSKDITIKSVRSTLHLRNNYKTDVDVKVYLCQPRDSTDLLCGSVLDNAVPENSNQTGFSYYGLNPSDFKQQVGKIWNMKLILNSTLGLGKGAKCSYSINKPFTYNPASASDEPQEFNRAQKSFHFLILIRGSIGHDSAGANQIGIMGSGVDFIETQTMTINYNAGTNINRVYQVNNLDAPGTTFVQTAQPRFEQAQYGA